MISKTDAAPVPESLPKQMLIFALPIMAMNILQLMFNAADMVVVGRFSGVQHWPLWELQVLSST